jgi:hypothetical protein
MPRLFEHATGPTSCTGRIRGEVENDRSASIEECLPPVATGLPVQGVAGNSRALPGRCWSQTASCLIGVPMAE